MSHIEQEFRVYLSKHPEIERACMMGLVNRRSLARHLVSEGVASQVQMEALIGMLRRYPFKDAGTEMEDVFMNLRVRMKDKIVLLDFGKDTRLIRTLEKVIASVDYDKGDTLKIVVGSGTIKLFIDDEHLEKVLKMLDINRKGIRMSHVAELSLLFGPDAQTSKGVIATITRQFQMHDILILELLTASPELIIYIDEKDVPKAYEIIKGL